MHGGDRKSTDAKSSSLHANLIDSSKTCDRIAEENGVSRASVLRASHYTRGIDIADNRSPGIKQKVLRLAGSLHGTVRKANGLRTLPDPKKLDAEYQTLSSEKNGFYTRYKKAQIELRELRTAQQNVEAFFRKEERSHAVPQQEVK